MSVVLTATELQNLLHQQNATSVRLFDVSRPSVHAQLHLPSAHLILRKNLSTGALPASGTLPDLSILEQWVNQLGITENDHIIAYDDEGGGWAGRFLWNLAMLGHKNYSLLSGGLHAWLKHGFEVEEGDHSSAALTTPPYPVTYQADLRALQKDVLAQVQTAQSNTSVATTNKEAVQPTQLWDCRSRAEFKGEQLLARRGGHIPTAKHLDWVELYDRENALQLYPKEILQQKLQAAGLQRHLPTTVYCQTHHRSGLAFIVAQWLGIKVRAYDGGWSEWGNDSLLPAVK